MNAKMNATMAQMCRLLLKPFCKRQTSDELLRHKNVSMLLGAVGCFFQSSCPNELQAVAAEVKHQHVT